MATNPGGVVDPNDLVGRDREFLQLIRSVDTGGAKLLGDRRMGKTSLTSKAAEELRLAGHEVIQISAEASDADRFNRQLLQAVARGRHFPKLLASWEAELGGELKFDVGPAGFQLTGKASRSPDRGVDFLQACLELSQRIAPYRVVFFFDEITVLAEKLATDAPTGPMDFFRMLREPRQHRNGVAMVLTGSVGLHHVLQDNSPVNDLARITVGALSPNDAHYLARCLIRGSNLRCVDDVIVADTIVEQTCAIPYYVHLLVQELAQRRLNDLGPADVVTAVDYSLRDDLWEMQHYVDRIAQYYEAESPLALRVLDEYAVSTTPLTLGELGRRVAASDGMPIDRERLLMLVGRLEDDHYLRRDGRADRFATSLLRRAWLEMRRP